LDDLTGCGSHLRAGCGCGRTGTQGSDDYQSGDHNTAAMRRGTSRSRLQQRSQLGRRHRADIRRGVSQFDKELANAGLLGQAVL
jgi:hypothetical protein